MDDFDLASEDDFGITLPGNISFLETFDHLRDSMRRKGWGWTISNVGGLPLYMSEDDLRDDHYAPLVFLMGQFVEKLSLVLPYASGVGPEEDLIFKSDALDSLLNAHHSTYTQTTLLEALRRVQEEYCDWLLLTMLQQAPGPDHLFNRTLHAFHEGFIDHKENARKYMDEARKEKFKQALHAAGRLDFETIRFVESIGQEDHSFGAPISHGAPSSPEA